ncbi:Ig-like domain-containing protein [Sporocytophaga myxococcoides]|uniref:Ig-like domain-containing protein n=1 Tax=Sporocytophaga myxococcoides TaxID=153721 RepID=UPI0004084A9D|nr:Ig-like domain-containing protein [Sporocytophaga myxococcoides]
MNYNFSKSITFIYLFISPLVILSQPSITGELKQWHKVTLTFTGPSTSEKDIINPFSDYRLNVYFTSGNHTYIVPGYYATDGNAHNTSDSTGNKWKVNFNPPETGTWSYKTSFRYGTNIAASSDSLAGSAIATIDGTTGSFSVSASDKSGKDFRGKGWLEHHNEHYYKFKGTGTYFLKNGAGSPENFLAYWEFDNTQDHTGGTVNNLPDGLHHYAPHLSDWKAGDTTWKNGLGKGIIGAINYLSSKDISEFFFLLMNVNGDGREVYPWTTYTETKRYDVSKLDQWEIVFSHMEKKGITLQLVFQEAENDRMLNNGNLGIERIIYYREMIARFSHHNAVLWNLGEETNRSTAQLKADAAFFKKNDPYKHPVKVHTKANSTSPDQLYTPLLGDINFDGTSLQQPNTVGHSLPIKWRNLSAQAGYKWVIEHDEVNGGLNPDSPAVNNQVTLRKNVLWGNLTGGGGGNDWYFGYDNSRAIDDLDCEDFRSRDKFWNYGKYALNLFYGYLPFQSMEPMDQNISNSASNWLLGSNTEKKYVAYLSKGGTATVNIPAGNWKYRIYNPVTGEFTNQSTSLVNQTLTSPNSNDWAFFIFSEEGTNISPTVNLTSPTSNQTFGSTQTINIIANAQDANGTISKVEFYLDDSLIFTDLISPYTYSTGGLTIGTHDIKVKATDNALATASDSVNIIIKDFPNQVPSVNITSPEDNSEITYGTNFTINATATDNDGYIKYVEFYQNNLLIGTDSIASYAVDINNLPQGTYHFMAKAYDDSLAFATDSVLIKVIKKPNQLPLAHITFPANLSNFTTGANTTVTATASDPDGVIKYMEFYFDNLLLGKDSVPSYSFPILNLQTGTHIIRIKAYDDSTAYSQDSVQISVTSGPDYLQSFTLINANTEQPVAGFDPIPNNSIINRNVTGGNLNIRANTAPSGFGCIKFELDGVSGRIENTAPYAMTGDNNGNYNSWTPPLGVHRLKGYAYSQTNAQGTLLDTLTIFFTVTSTATLSARESSQQYSIYPNPFENELKITFINEEEIVAEAVLVSTLGFKYFAEVQKTNAGTFRILPPVIKTGIYMLEVTTERGTIIRATIQK